MTCIVLGGALNCTHSFAEIVMSMLAACSTFFCATLQFTILSFDAFVFVICGIWFHVVRVVYLCDLVPLWREHITVFHWKKLGDHASGYEDDNYYYDYDYRCRYYWSLISVRGDEGTRIGRNYVVVTGKTGCQIEYLADWEFAQRFSLIFKWNANIFIMYFPPQYTVESFSVEPASFCEHLDIIIIIMKTGWTY